MIYRRIARLGKFKLKVSLHQCYHRSCKPQKHQKVWPNWLQTINIIWLFNSTHIFCCSGASLCKLFYGQACLIGQPRKKGIAAACLLICYICLDYCVTIQKTGPVYSIVTHVEVWLFCCYLFNSPNNPRFLGPWPHTHALRIRPILDIKEFFDA